MSQHFQSACTEAGEGVGRHAPDTAWPRLFYPRLRLRRINGEECHSSIGNNFVTDTAQRVLNGKFKKRV